MNCTCRHNSYVSEAVTGDVLLALKGDPCQSLLPQEGACSADSNQYLNYTLKGEKRLFSF